LLPFAINRGVFRVPDEEPGNNRGLWFAEAVVGGFGNTGDGSGASAGVLSCVASGATCGVVDADWGGLEKLADSGSSNDSMCSASTVSWPPALAAEVRLFGEVSFISDAGVAGDGAPGRGM